jgi:ABC-type transporter Mla subunit MlaD
MSDEVFRVIVAVAVSLAALAFVIQAVVVIALYRASKQTGQKVTEWLVGARPILAKVEPVLDRIGPTIDRIGPVIDQVGPALEKAGPALERIGPAADKVGEMVEKVGVVLSTANQIMQETRPKIHEISEQTLAIAKSGREQVERLGSLLENAGDRARTRLEQIDHTLENTVDQVEQVGDTMKRAVMKPVREVNGLAAGISAAVSTLVHGTRKSSVDSATQDEEMFI